MTSRPPVDDRLRSPAFSRRMNMNAVTHSDSDSNTTRTPSIVKLENLHMEPSQEYTVAIVDPVYHRHHSNNNSTHRSVHNKTPIHSYQADKTEVRQKTLVFVTVVYLKIGDIDTIKENFEAEVFIQAKWREPLLDHIEKKVTNFKHFWNPELIMQNTLDEPKARVWHEVHLTDMGEAYILERRKIKGKFNETMELNNFPFDIQGISVVISSELSTSRVKLVENNEDLSYINVDCFSDSQEWILHDFMELETTEISANYTKSRDKYSALVVTCCVTRRPGFFAWNILVVVNLLSIFAFTTFAVDSKLTPNRLQLSFILILAAISFRNVANQSIPKISYLTHLDRYNLISMVFQGFICFWHGIVSRFDYDETLQSKLDFWAFIIFLVVYFIYNVVFIGLMSKQHIQNMNEIRNREDKFKAKARRILGDSWAALRTEEKATPSLLERINSSASTKTVRRKEINA
ncbi:gamma-aminobutyric acid receptor subunit gamma-3-like [Dreissena polymorpha]|uniref:Neurotransmitter-gated ion-channel ligand-binding domain-containing protein n=1 Tax=Dreissena polymorpha TaxID=45954 RepID=A0A9D4QQ25_DREPO|nr:gamma-aminobutyric acid receptor subunit gamma-3-like [Dreissena polymorpha]KAH3838170.1 hypothetical protein DPMN_111577 [Dreissena polymorpha]